MQIKITKINDNANYSRGTPGSAGIDIHALTDGCLPIYKSCKLPTGLVFEIPENYVGLILDKSSLGSKGITITGGVIDSDYRGEIFLCMINLGNAPHYYKQGDKLGQMIIVPFINNINPVHSERTGGFGSTGK